MKAYAVSPVVLAVALSACQTTGAQKTNTAGLLDPRAQTLQAAYLDRSFSLADVYEARLNAALANSDRRAMDAALDAALAEPADAHATTWSNPLSDHTGDVDVLRWEDDAREGQLCGALAHSAMLGAAMAGRLVICRAPEETAWRVDEVVWNDAEETQPAPRRRLASRSTAPVASDPAAPTETVVSSETSAHQRPSGYRPPECPSDTGGAVALGDCLAAPN